MNKKPRKNQSRVKPRYFKSHSRKTGSQDSESDSARNPVPTYLILNKPYQVLTRFTDPNGRSTLADYVSVPEVYPAGRLDFDSEGLLVLTDDGPLAHRLTDPRFDHPKTYLAQVERIPEESSLDKIRKGIILGDGPCKPADIELLKEEPKVWDRSEPIRFRKTVPTCWLSLTISEGRNRQVRRMTAAIGHPCLRLIRWSIGNLELGDLEPGQWRYLTAEEIPELRKIQSIKRNKRS